MKQRIKQFISFHLQSAISSYGQIFFSLDTWLAVLLLVLSLLDIRVGFGGLLAVVLTNFIAHVLGFSKDKIRNGLYGFNAVFVGMCLMNKFYFTASFAALFIFAVLLMFMLTVLIETVFSKQKLPVLTFPFVLTMLIVDLSYPSFSYIMPIAPFDRYTTLLAKQMDVPWYGLIHSMDNITLPLPLFYYFKTLASVFFTDSIMVGVLIAIGLLLHSRIKSTVAFLGFIGAYYSLMALGVDIQVLTRDLGGINYIFWGMAMGSFFIIPNVYSYLLVICLTPALFLFYAGTESLFASRGLSSYTLAFSFLSILVLVILRQRSIGRFFIFPAIQHYDPEKTVYKNVNHISRFANDLLFKMQLPFVGEWKVSQGYNGQITHLGDWGRALDFVITDEDNKTYSGSGVYKEDYYCFNKPVFAPADGYVYQISNHTDDNAINEVDTNKNWGNTIIINHLNGIFTQISHLEKDSFKVRVGDYVPKGTLLATCGNSGRSPEPHVHFQVQHSPEIGAITQPYPIAYFFETRNGQTVLHINKIPQMGMAVSNVQSMSFISSSFQFTPGRTLHVTHNGKEFEWEIATNAYNQLYISCSKSKSTAYIANDGTMFYFYDFEGKKSSPLYLFYRSCFRMLLSSEKGIDVNDSIPLTKEHVAGTKWIQDILSPFVMLSKIKYRSQLLELDNKHYPQNVVFKNDVQVESLWTLVKMSSYRVAISHNKIEITSKKDNLCIVW